VADEVYVFDRFGSPTITLESVTPGGTYPTVICTQPSVGVGKCLAFLSADEAMVPTENVHNDVDAFLKLVPVTTPTAYGDARTYNGCTPTMSSTGTPSTTLPTAFTVSTTNLPGHTTSPPLGDGYFFYSVTAPHNAPLSGSFFANGLPNGLLLAEPSTFRVQPPFATGGTTGQCNGAAAFDFNPLIQSGSNPALTLGAEVWVQTFCRDPSPLGRTYSNGLWFVIQ
jgi:hypothetical protein